jgi:hypothetical protein
MNIADSIGYLGTVIFLSHFKQFSMSKLTGYRSVSEQVHRNQHTDSDSMLNNMEHLNELLRKQTQENLFLGTRNFD